MARNKRSYQWIGAANVFLPKTDASSATTGILEIAPALLRTAPVQGRTDCLIEAIYIHISTHRVLTTTLDAAGIIVWVANVSEGSDNASQTLDALSTEDRAYSNKNILIMEPFAVPPTVSSSDLVSVAINDAVLVSKHSFQATRKLDRSSQVLALQVNADVSDVIRCFIQVRALLSYGAR